VNIDGKRRRGRTIEKEEQMKERYKEQIVGVTAIYIPI
jgi:hypothetical protein